MYLFTVVPLDEGSHSMKTKVSCKSSLALHYQDHNVMAFIISILLLYASYGAAYALIPEPYLRDTPKFSYPFSKLKKYLTSKGYKVVEVYPFDIGNKNYSSSIGLHN